VQLEKAYIESYTESKTEEQRGEAIRQVPNTPTALNSYAVLPPVPAPCTDEWDFLHVTSSDVYNNQSVQSFIFGSAKIVSDTFACLFKQMQSKEGAIVLHKGYTTLQQAFASYQSALDERSDSSFNEVLSSGGIDVLDKVYLYFLCAIDSFQSKCLKKNGAFSMVSGGGRGQETAFTQSKQKTTPLSHHSGHESRQSSSSNGETNAEIWPPVPSDVLIEKLLDRLRTLPESKGVLHDRLLRGIQFLPELKDCIRRILDFPTTPQVNAYIERWLYSIFSQPILRIVTVQEYFLLLERDLQSVAYDNDARNR
jgi:hypothetical protein